MQLFVRDLNGCSVAVVADAQQNVGQLKVRASFSAEWRICSGEIRDLSAVPDVPDVSISLGGIEFGKFGGILQEIPKTFT